jgi:hypothetical protein
MAALVISGSCHSRHAGARSWALKNAEAVVIGEPVVENQRIMVEGKASRPSLTRKAADDKARREARVAAEMRKNLMKRKRQRRDRKDESPNERSPGQNG